VAHALHEAFEMGDGLRETSLDRVPGPPGEAAVVVEDPNLLRAEEPPAVPLAVVRGAAAQRKVADLLGV
jgi:hypothetical protein